MINANNAAWENAMEEADRDIQFQKAHENQQRGSNGYRGGGHR